MENVYSLKLWLLVLNFYTCMNFYYEDFLLDYPGVPIKAEIHLIQNTEYSSERYLYTDLFGL